MASLYPSPVTSYLDFSSVLLTFTKEETNSSENSNNPHAVPAADDGPAPPVGLALSSPEASSWDRAIQQLSMSPPCASCKPARQHQGWVHPRAGSVLLTEPAWMEEGPEPGCDPGGSVLIKLDCVSGLGLVPECGVPHCPSEGAGLLHWVPWSGSGLRQKLASLFIYQACPLFLTGPCWALLPWC